MRIPIVALIVVLVMSFLLDWYIWRVTIVRFKSRIYSRVQLVSALALWLMLVVAVALPRRSGSDATLLCIMWMLFGYITVYSSKLFFVITDIIASIPRLWHKQRIHWLSRIGCIGAVMMFIVMWWGALINRFNHQIVEETVYIENLPECFEDFRIVHISDLHTGTYGNDTTYMSEIVESVNNLKPDVILFTGDIVNRHSEELKPHISVLSKLHSPRGVYAVLGNHDYGDYSDWETAEAKKADFMKMVNYIRHDMGWKLLLNQSAVLKSDCDSIILIGVENVGDPPFKTYGSLSKAYATPGDSLVKILLTHNPAHWVDSIRANDNINIPLTLSGHTHAMQMEVGGISPAAWRYDTWGGLYNDASESNLRHQLYVNIGIGTVGLPMRIGATPEITILTLKRASSRIANP